MWTHKTDTEAKSLASVAKKISPEVRTGSLTPMMLTVTRLRHSQIGEW